MTGPSTVFYMIYARQTLHLTPYQVGDIVFWGYFGGVAGNFLGGWLIDRIGRKYTCAGAYTLGGVSIYMLYHVSALPAQYVWMILTVFSFAGGYSATHVYASELFPTEIRATGYGWTSNLAGRITEVAVPLVIGLLIAPLGGIPAAIALVVHGPDPRRAARAALRAGDARPDARADPAAPERLNAARLYTSLPRRPRRETSASHPSFPRRTKR